MTVAVCAQCGASTPAKTCPRCGGETTPFATPRPEGARPASALPPAATTMHLPTVPVQPSVAPIRQDDTVVLPVVPGAGSGAVAGERPSPWAATPLPDPSQPAAPPPPPVPVAATRAAPVRTSGPFAGRSAALLAAVVVVLLAASGLVWWLTHRSGGIASIARKAPAEVVLPATAEPCAVTDARESGLQVYSGNRNTSCGLADNTRLKLGERRGSVTVDPVSPKTRLKYVMQCDGDPVVTCTGGKGAVVYLVPRESRVVIGSK